MLGHLLIQFQVCLVANVTDQCIQGTEGGQFKSLECQLFDSDVDQIGWVAHRVRCLANNICDSVRTTSVVCLNLQEAANGTAITRPRSLGGFRQSAFQLNIAMGGDVFNDCCRHCTQLRHIVEFLKALEVRGQPETR